MKLKKSDDVKQNYQHSINQISKRFNSYYLKYNIIISEMKLQRSERIKMKSASGTNKYQTLFDDDNEDALHPNK